VPQKIDKQSRDLSKERTKKCVCVCVVRETMQLAEEKTKQVEQHKKQKTKPQNHTTLASHNTFT
jgi:hypothetical protein